MDLGLDDLEHVHERYETDLGEYAKGLVSTPVAGDPPGYWTTLSISPEGATEIRHNTVASIYTGLRVLVGEFPLLEDTDVMPVKIATETKPIIAAYLLAAHLQYDTIGGWARRKEVKQQLAERMDVTYGTFQEYVARARRKAMEYRIGGAAQPHWV